METTCCKLSVTPQKEIEQLRRINKQVDEELKAQRDLSKKTELGFMGDLECIRKELSRACKNNQELEVTNSELKEEVRATRAHSHKGRLSDIDTRELWGK